MTIKYDDNYKLLHTINNIVNNYLDFSLVKFSKDDNNIIISCKLKRCYWFTVQHDWVS